MATEFHTLPAPSPQIALESIDFDLDFRLEPGASSHYGFGGQIKTPEGCETLSCWTGPCCTATCGPSCITACLPPNPCGYEPPKN